MAPITRHARLGATRARSAVHDGRVYTVAVSPVKSASMEEQAREALKQLDAHLEEAGTDKRHVLSATVFITDMGRKAEMNAVWDAWIDPANPPQRACIGATLEGDDLIEFVVVAALPD